MAKQEVLFEASVEWQGTVLGVTHFAQGSRPPPELSSYEGVGEALKHLEREGIARTSVGPLSLSIRRVPGGTPGERALPRKPLDWALFGCVSASMIFAGLLLALMALVPPSGQAMSIPEVSLAGRLVPFEGQPPELFETEPLAAGDSLPEEESGPEWGTEGLAGSREATDRPRTRSERESEAPNLRAAAQQAGVLSLGAIFDGAGASRSPFERALGRDADAALGNLTGSVSGESFGFGGLAMNGTGRHAGGLGLDAIRQPDGGGGYGSGTLCGCVHRAMGGGGSASGFASVERTGPGETVETRESRVPRIRSTGAEVRGALDPAVIRRVVRRHQNETRYCYEQALQTQPELAGRVEARFVIDPGGAVVAATLDSSTLASSHVESCVLQVVRRMNFPATPGGNVSVVSYPWVFSTL